MSASFLSMDHSSGRKKNRNTLDQSAMNENSLIIDNIKRNSVRPKEDANIKASAAIEDTNAIISALKQSVGEMQKKYALEISSLKREIAQNKASIPSSDSSAILGRYDSVIDNLGSKLQQLETRLASYVTDLQRSISDISLSGERKLSNTVDTLRRELLQSKTSQSNMVVTADPSSVSKKEHDLKVLGLQAEIKKLSDASLVHSNTLSSLDKKINTEVTKVHSDMHTRHEDTRTQISQLHSHIQGLSDASKRTPESKKVIIGEEFNMPEQPAVLKEGGAHRVAPLSLVVNGGVVLYDIGYVTDKKGLVPVYIDPVTSRLVVYYGK